MVPSSARGAAVLLLMVLLAACASGGSGSHVRGTNRNVIDADEIARTRHTSAFSLVQALRPHWLQVRGGGGMAGKRVYLDEISAGGLDVLRGVSTSTIASIQYWDGPAATQRWGLDHGAGVIQIWTRTQ